MQPRWFPSFISLDSVTTRFLRVFAWYIKRSALPTTPSDGFICPGNCSSKYSQKAEARHIPAQQPGGSYHGFPAVFRQISLLLLREAPEETHPLHSGSEYHPCGYACIWFLQQQSVHIPGIMSICVVIKLKIVQIDHAIPAGPSGTSILLHNNVCCKHLSEGRDKFVFVTG